MVLGQCLEVMRANQRRLASSLANPVNSESRLDTREVRKHLALVPFRYSKLTEALMDYFVGDGRTVMIVNINPYDTGFDENAHVMRFAALAREVNDLRAARASLVALLRRLPHDLNVLAALRPVLVELGDLAACAEFYETAWKHYQEAFPTGQAGADGAANPFGVLEILVLADLHSALGAHQRAIHVVKTGMRWLQGRGTQAYWDAVPDDRECVSSLPTRTIFFYPLLHCAIHPIPSMVPVSFRHAAANRTTS